MQTELKHEIKSRLVDTLVSTFVRILISILSFVVISVIIPQFIDFDLSDILDSPEEKETKKNGKEIINDLENNIGIKLPELNSHEMQIASTIYHKTDKSFGFESIGGLSEIKKDLSLHFVTPLKNPDVFFKNPSLRPPSGILLTGPPGNGKTSLVKAVAAESQVPLIVFSLSNVESKYVGESQKLLNAVFTLATKIQPCIIFIDELDSVMRTRNAFEQAHEYSMKTSLLQHLDGISTSSDRSYVVIAATNFPQSLDPAVKRRLPRKYEIGKPDEVARRQIFDIITSSNSESKVPQWLVEDTDELSAAEITEIYNRACSIRNETISGDDGIIEKIRNGTLNIPRLKAKHWRKALELQTE